MIKEAYVSYDVAKLLKEKGFDEPCWSWFEDENYMRESNDDYGYQTNTDHISEDFLCSRPTQQMAMRWLREEKHICIEPYSYNHKFVCSFSKLPECISIFCEQESNEYDTYEEAVEAALKYALENLV